MRNENSEVLDLLNLRLYILDMNERKLYIEIVHFRLRLYILDMNERKYRVNV